MVFKDYYKVLGLNSNKVSEEDIKIAYRDKAKQYHPDINVGKKNSEELGEYLYDTEFVYRRRVPVQPDNALIFLEHAIYRVSIKHRERQRADCVCFAVVCARSNLSCIIKRRINYMACRTDNIFNAIHQNLPSVYLIITSAVTSLTTFHEVWLTS